MLRIDEHAHIDELVWEQALVVVRELRLELDGSVAESIWLSMGQQRSGRELDLLFAIVRIDASLAPSRQSLDQRDRSESSGRVKTTPPAVPA